MTISSNLFLKNIGLASCVGMLFSAVGWANLEVIGEGTVHYAPDRLSIEIGVTNNEATGGAAVRANAQVMTAVVNALQEAVGDSGEVGTSGFRVNPIMTYNQATQQQELQGYVAVNSVLVTTSNLSQVGDLIDLATESGANQINSLHFFHSDPSSYRDQALTMAFADARQQAQALASAAEVDIAGIETITTQPVMNVPTMLRSAEIAYAGDASTPIEASAVSTVQTVRVVYEIND